MDLIKFDILLLCNCRYFFDHLEAFAPLLNNTSTIEKFTIYVPHLLNSPNLSDRRGEPTR